MEMTLNPIKSHNDWFVLCSFLVTIGATDDFKYQLMFWDLNARKNVKKFFPPHLQVKSIFCFLFSNQ